MKYHHAASDPGIEKDMFSDLQNHLGGGRRQAQYMFTLIFSMTFSGPITRLMLVIFPQMTFSGPITRLMLVIFPQMKTIACQHGPNELSNLKMNITALVISTCFILSIIDLQILMNMTMNGRYVRSKIHSLTKITVASGETLRSTCM